MSSSHLPRACIISITYRLVYSHKNFPITYLGCPLFEGCKDKNLFDPLLEKLQARVGSWHRAFLNLAGKVTLINLVLHSITMYQIVTLDPPKSIIKAIERLFANFFGGQIKGKSKAHWVSWASCCKPVLEGGIGIHSIQDVMKAFSIKIW